MLEQSRLEDEIELDVEGDRIIIRSARRPSEGWDEAFARMAKTGDDRLLDEPSASQSAWDEDEWQRW